MVTETVIEPRVGASFEEMSTGFTFCGLHVIIRVLPQLQAPLLLSPPELLLLSIKTWLEDHMLS